MTKRKGHNGEELPAGITATTEKGKQQYKVTWFERGQKQRKFYDKLKPAKDWTKQMKKDKEKGIAKLRALSNDDQIDLLNAFLRAQKNGYSLHEACAAFEKSPELLPTLKFGDARERFIAGKKLKNLRPRSIRTYESTLDHVGMTFDEVDLHQIAKVDFQDWLLDQNFKPKTINNYIGHLNTLRNWIAKQNFEVGRFNPFDLEKIEIDADDPVIFDVDEVLPYLSAAIKVPEVGLVVCLVLLCGLRVSEAVQTSINDMKLDRQKPIIVVKSQCAKKRQRRIIEITPMAAAWLKAAIDAGCIQPESEAQFIKARKANNLRTAANVLRHTFISYHVAEFGNKNDTAQKAGNSPDMIEEFYLELVDPIDANKFFTTFP